MLRRFQRSDYDAGVSRRGDGRPRCVRVDLLTCSNPLIKLDLGRLAAFCGSCARNPYAALGPGLGEVDTITELTNIDLALSGLYFVRLILIRHEPPLADKFG